MNVKCITLTLIAIVVAVVGHDILSWLTLYSISGKALSMTAYTSVIHAPRFVYFTLISVFASISQRIPTKPFLGLYVLVEAVKYFSLTRTQPEADSIIQVNVSTLFYVVLVVGVFVGYWIGIVYLKRRRAV